MLSTVEQIEMTSGTSGLSRDRVAAEMDVDIDPKR
jgi:hypothetical protein